MPKFSGDLLQLNKPDFARSVCLYLYLQKSDHAFDVVCAVFISSSSNAHCRHFFNSRVLLTPTLFQQDRYLSHLMLYLALLISFLPAKSAAFNRLEFNWQDGPRTVTTKLQSTSGLQF